MHFDVSTHSRRLFVLSKSGAHTSNGSNGSALQLEMREVSIPCGNSTKCMEPDQIKDKQSTRNFLHFRSCDICYSLRCVRRCFLCCSAKLPRMWVTSSCFKALTLCALYASISTAEKCKMWGKKSNLLEFLFASCLLNHFIRLPGCYFS